MNTWGMWGSRHWRFHLLVCSSGVFSCGWAEDGSKCINMLYWDVLGIWILDCDGLVGARECPKTQSTVFFFTLVWMLVGGLEHFLFFHILGIIIPTDFHIFQLKPPVIHDGNSVLSQPGQWHEVKSCYRWAQLLIHPHIFQNNHNARHNEMIFLSPCPKEIEGFSQNFLFLYNL